MFPECMNAVIVPTLFTKAGNKTADLLSRVALQGETPAKHSASQRAAPAAGALLVPISPS